MIGLEVGGETYTIGGSLSRVVGVWTQTREGQRLAVRIERFGAMPSTIRSRVREEAEDLGRFLDLPQVAVTFA